MRTVTHCVFWDDGADMLSLGGANGINLDEHNTVANYDMYTSAFHLCVSHLLFDVFVQHSTFPPLALFSRMVDPILTVSVLSSFLVVFSRRISMVEASSNEKTNPR